MQLVGFGWKRQLLCRRPSSAPVRAQRSLQKHCGIGEFSGAFPVQVTVALVRQQAKVPVRAAVVGRPERNNHELLMELDIEISGEMLSSLCKSLYKQRRIATTLKSLDVTNSMICVYGGTVQAVFFSFHAVQLHYAPPEDQEAKRVTDPRLMSKLVASVPHESHTKTLCKSRKFQRSDSWM
ncbi:uncharacterized protein VSU04_012587 isoform 2-T3 [Chlamydotis macqueenii]